MVEYVPFYTIVRPPLRTFRLRYKDEMVFPGISAREAVQQASCGNIDVYQRIVNHSSSFGFYFHAPAEAHTIISTEGEIKLLKYAFSTSGCSKQLPNEK